MLRQNDVLNGTYQIVKEIGSGGMGIIYLAYHLNLQKYVVVKKIKDDFVGAIEARSEVDIMKNLRHTYLPQIYDFIQLGTEIYTVMNYIEGYDFNHYVKAGCRFTEEQLTKWLTQCLEVLQYLHSGKPAIIHSDIKPANIMLDVNGNICLIDFNISFDNETGSSIIAASVNYASPEQLHPVAVYMPDGSTVWKQLTDERTDIYSLGATFYQLATGLAPHEGIIDEYPITEMDLCYSEGFVRVIEKAMQMNPDDRYQSARNMLADVKNIHKHSAAYKLMRLAIIAGVCAIGALAGCGGVMAYRGYQDKKQKQFDAEYKKLIRIEADYEPELAIEKTIEVLNNEAYDGFFEDNPMRKGMLLYQLATAYYALGDYSEANRYFAEAILYMENADCYRDYAISLARAGNLEEARQLIDSHEDIMPENDVLQIKAEMDVMQGNYQEAVRNLEYLMGHSANMEERMRSLILLCDVYEQQGRYEDIISVLNQNNTFGNYTDMVNGIYADAYMGLAASAKGDEKQSYYTAAEQYLEQLDEKGRLNFDDRINLAIVYQNLGKYTKAQQYLNQLLLDYPEDYRVLMQMSYLEYNSEIEKTVAERDFSSFDVYYTRALNAYNAQTNDGIIDDRINQLMQLRQDLKDKGYL